MRRPESLLRNLLTHRQRGCPPAGADTLCRQRRAIRNAAGYGQSFVLWTFKIAHFHFFPVVLPDPEWLRDLLTYVRFDCDAELQALAKRRAALFQDMVAHDEATGSAQGFRALRASGHHTVQALPVVERQPLSKAFDTSPHSAAYAPFLLPFSVLRLVLAPMPSQLHRLPPVTSANTLQLCCLLKLTASFRISGILSGTGIHSLSHVMSCSGKPSCAWCLTRQIDLHQPWS